MAKKSIAIQTYSGKTTKLGRITADTVNSDSSDNSYSSKSIYREVYGPYGNKVQAPISFKGESILVFAERNRISIEEAKEILTEALLNPYNQDLDIHNFINSEINNINNSDILLDNIISDVSN